jgi:hypothetical protein
MAVMDQGREAVRRAEGVKLVRGLGGVGPRWARRTAAGNLAGASIPGRESQRREL